LLLAACCLLLAACCLLLAACCLLLACLLAAAADAAATVDLLHDFKALLPNKAIRPPPRFLKAVAAPSVSL
jgi:hypothetical protein